MSFGRKKGGGWVYVAESTRPDGTKKLYTGITRKSPYKRWGQHMHSQSYSNNSSWTSKGAHFKPLGANWSANPEKAERTLKRSSPERKRAFGRFGAYKYAKRND